MADRTCLWCGKEVGYDEGDEVWFHSETGKVECADGEHRADPLPLRPLTGGRLVLYIVVGLVLASFVIGMLQYCNGLGSV